MDSMSSSRPYIIRAVHEWIEANQNTPYLMVDAMLKGVEVPQQFVNDGRIVLNLSTSAVQGLSIADEGILFSARFNKIPHEIWVPTYAVLGIFSKENGLGMYFDESGDIVPPPPPPPPGNTKDKPEAKDKASQTKSKNGNKAGLRIIK